MKFTPENIKHLAPNQIFTYGANTAGIHGAGAAKLALRWGAKMGEYGLNGQTYGIPTKDKKIQTLPLDKIQVHVNDFLATAFSHQEYEFLVTKIGCGLALYSLQKSGQDLRQYLSQTLPLYLKQLKQQEYLKT